MVGSMLEVDPTQSYGENTKSPIQDFHGFCYKNLLKFIFWSNFSSLSVISTLLLSDSTISSWFWTETAKKTSREFLENFSFHQNFQFSGSTTLYISCHKLVELWPRTQMFSPKYPLRIPSKVSCGYTYGKSQSFRRYQQRYQGGQNDPIVCFCWPTELGISRVNS